MLVEEEDKVGGAVPKIDVSRFAVVNVEVGRHSIGVDAVRLVSGEVAVSRLAVEEAEPAAPSL